jgi:hypothetical protein
MRYMETDVRRKQGGSKAGLPVLAAHDLLNSATCWKLSFISGRCKQAAPD